MRALAGIVTGVLLFVAPACGSAEPVKYPYRHEPYASGAPGYGLGHGHGTAYGPARDHRYDRGYRDGNRGYGDRPGWDGSTYGQGPWACRVPDTRVILTPHRDGVSVSLLGPYRDAPALRTQARRLARHYERQPVGGGRFYGVGAQASVQDLPNGARVFLRAYPGEVSQLQREVEAGSAVLDMQCRAWRR